MHSLLSALLETPKDEVSITEDALELHLIDTGLYGISGARTVLKAIVPATQRLNLSHNALGDDGVAALCAGLTEMRKANKHAGLTELSLASNDIGDTGLIAIVQHLLLPSGPPSYYEPTLEKLTLNANQITLSEHSPAASLLSAALSHPSSRLVALSLTGNTLRTSNFFSHCCPTALRELHLNTCGITHANDIIDWLQRGGSRLEDLRLNGNYLSLKSCVRLVLEVNECSNVRLHRLELSANRTPGDPVRPIRAWADSFNTTEEIAEVPYELMLAGSRQRLRMFADIQRVVHRTAFAILSCARVLLLSRSQFLPKQILCAKGQQDAVATPSTVPPWLTLPYELQVYILRHLSDSYVSEMPLPTTLTNTFLIPEPLSPIQQANIIRFAQDRQTILNPPTSTPRRKHLSSNEKMAVLQYLDCEQFDGSEKYRERQNI